MRSINIVLSWSPKNYGDPLALSSEHVDVPLASMRSINIVLS